MTDDNFSSESKKRRKRKWDQPAEILVSAGVAVPGIPLVGSLNSATLSSGVSEPVLANTIGVSSMVRPPLFQIPFVHPLVTTVAPKPKIQDELIAREIMINDADSAIRYKLTKRQTQEEIQKGSGAIVITRGKYRPPNVPADNERPLYLHISASTHLETTMERIRAVDLAAAMVEEMLKQGTIPNGSKVIHPFSISVFLGFEADPSLNIASRIRGPNDQFVNHIMNETGATVILRGHGSGNTASSFEEERQPLHLFLSSSNPQSLERAKLLAENLLDTISREFGASRTLPNIYSAVPPPPPLANAERSVNQVALNSSSTISTLIPAVSSVTNTPVSSATHTGVGLSSMPSQSIMGRYPLPSLNGATSYYGYGGIYPQATPLQQVALALRQSPTPVNSTVSQATTATSVAASSSETLSSEKEKRRRKFQELPAASNGCAKSDQNLLQGTTFLKPSEPKINSGERNLSTVPAPRKLVSSEGMPPPPPRTMPPPPPSMFNSPTPAPKVPKNNVLDKPKQESIPDTLIKLMEYGEEDDETDEEPRKGNSNGLATSKPFCSYNFYVIVDIIQTGIRAFFSLV